MENEGKDSIFEETPSQGESYWSITLLPGPTAGAAFLQPESGLFQPSFNF